MNAEQEQVLTAEQRAHFLERGWVKLEGGIPPENVEKFVNNIWTRLGYSPTDKSTWESEYLHLPRHREYPHKEFCPKQYKAMCELVGGEERIDPELFSKSGDGIICNFGTPYWVDHTIHPRDLTNWHVDGDWFRHFLDSGDQGLLVTQLFSDIVPHAGGTYICEDGLSQIVQWLYDHPEGTDFRDEKTGKTAYDGIKDCKVFTELTGKAGDVILIHPFMPHSASKNHLRNPRFITNPPITLKEPLNFNRANEADYSLLELLVVDRLKKLNLSVADWKITAPRSRHRPTTQARREATLKAELERMIKAAAETGEVVDSVHVRGEKLDEWKLNDLSPKAIAV